MKTKIILAAIVAFILLEELPVAAAPAEFSVKDYVGSLNLELVNKKTFEVYRNREVIGPDNSERIFFHEIEPGDYVLTAWPMVTMSNFKSECVLRTEVQVKDDDANAFNLTIPSGRLNITIEELGQKVPRIQEPGASVLLIRRIDKNGGQVPVLRWCSVPERVGTTLSAVIDRIGPGEYEAFFLRTEAKFGELVPVSAGRFVLKENNLKENKPFEVHLQWGKK